MRGLTSAMGAGVSILNILAIREGLSAAVHVPPPFPLHPPLYPSALT